MDSAARVAALKTVSASTVVEVAGLLCGAMDRATTALARVWLFDQSRDLRLVSSSGRPIGGGSYHRTDGQFAIARSEGKVARVGATGEALIACGLRGDEPWLENPVWIARQAIRSFVALPIGTDDGRLGVMALFDRALTPANVIDDLRFLADLAGVRLRHLHESARTSAIVTRPQLRDVERQSIEAALAESGGKVFGADGAAARLAMKPTTLASRIKALGVNVSERYN